MSDNRMVGFNPILNSSVDMIDLSKLLNSLN